MRRGQCKHQVVLDFYSLGSNKQKPNPKHSFPRFFHPSLNKHLRPRTLVSLVLGITVMEKVCGNSIVTIIENTTSGFFRSYLFVLCCCSAVVIYLGTNVSCASLYIVFHLGRGWWRWGGKHT